MMDVIAGEMPCKLNEFFEPKQLVDTWLREKEYALSTEEELKTDSTVSCTVSLHSGFAQHVVGVQI
jgi:hypothetical protein